MHWFSLFAEYHSAEYWSDDFDDLHYLAYKQMVWLTTVFQKTHRKPWVAGR
jgi:hypothetical protein